MFNKLLEMLGLHDKEPIKKQGWLPRWVVLDTETTGLSPWTDHLLSIAAVAIHCEPGFHKARIVFADRYETILHQDKPTHSKHNILIHHIGVQAQTQGRDQQEALQGFASWVADAPVFAFHAPFDRAMIAKALKKHDIKMPGCCWIDVAALARAASQDTVSASLDDRLQQFGVRCFERHQASADMLATAELLLRLLPDMKRQVHDLEGLYRLSQDYSLPPA